MDKKIVIGFVIGCVMFVIGLLGILYILYQMLF